MLEEAEWFMMGFMTGLGFGLSIVSQRVRSFLGSKKSTQKKQEDNAEG